MAWHENSMHDFYIYIYSMHVYIQAGGLASLAPATCDSDIFHYITVYTHNVHAIQVLIVNRAV